MLDLSVGRAAVERDRGVGRPAVLADLRLADGRVRAVTVATPGASAIRPSASVIARSAAGSVTLPSLSCQTTRPFSPAAPFEACCNRAEALAESVFCEVELELKALPATPAAAASPINRPTQTRTTASRCRWHQWARGDIDEPFQGYAM
ncbi:hypothetical protein [Streptomyces sp. NPDC001508]|uniref:hypothetical protein n=1 Tax=Streptomyces sp. NPDC001508 TaxID=3154656 RepID=UPI00332B9972